MNVSQPAINEFREIYKKEFHKELSEGEAIKMAENLLELFKTLIS